VQVAEEDEEGEEGEDSEGEEDEEGQDEDVDEENVVVTQEVEKVNFIRCECGKNVQDTPQAIKSHKRGKKHKSFMQRGMEHQKLDNVITEARSNPVIKEILDKITEPIMKYYNQVKPSEYEITQREAFRKYVQKMIWTQWEDASVHLFGSSATNIFSRDSDIDLCLIIPDTHGEETTIIQHLARYLRKLGVTHTLPLVTARVPILKLLSTGRIFRYKFDLCVNRPLGTHNSRLIRAYLDLDPRIRPLAFVLKAWSKRTRIHNPSGGLSSYALYLMLIFFLQTRASVSDNPPILPNFQENPTEEMEVMGYNCHFAVPQDWKCCNTETIGQLLVAFFEFYAYFDFIKYAVCIRFGKLAVKSATAFPHVSQRPVVIEDPFEIDFNCARLVKAHTLARIKRLMKTAFITLYTTQKIDDLISDPDPRPPRNDSRPRPGSGRGNNQNTPNRRSYGGRYQPKEGLTAPSSSSNSSQGRNYRPSPNRVSPNRVSPNKRGSFGPSQT